MSQAMLRWLLAGVLPCLAGCNTAMVASQQTLEIGGAHAMESRRQVRPAGYVLRPNDMIRVQVYNEPNVTGEYPVDAGGYVSIPLAGRVRAAGRTTQQLEQAITSQLNRDLIKDARVNVQIIGYPPIYVHGEVKRGGEIGYRPGITVMDAVASAGGFTYRADERKVYVRRSGRDVEELLPMDVRISLSPGDNIRVPERFF